MPVKPKPIKVYTSSSSTKGAPSYAERNGQTVTIVRKLTDKECDAKPWGEPVNMLRIRFADGVETDAFEEELT